MESRRLLTATVIATPDPHYWTHHDGGVYVSVLDGVLANDSGYDDSSGGGGSTLTATLQDNVSNGTLVFYADGSFNYTPASGFVGEETFTYLASYGSATSDPTTVTIDVTNEPPFTWNSSIEPFTVPRDQVLKAAPGTIQVNDTDDYLYLGMLTHTIVTDVEHGALLFNDNGSFKYTPTAGYVGPDSFTVTYSDTVPAPNTETSNEITVLINVVDKPPVAMDDEGYFCLGNAGSASVAADDGVLKNDTDEDTQRANLTAEIVDQPEHGVVILNADGSFTYILDDINYAGPETFTYKARDATGFGNIATATIQVGQLRIKTQEWNEVASVDVTNATQAIEAGVRQRLVAEIVNLGEGVNASFSWTIGGMPVKDYNGEEVTELSADDLSNSSVDWAWIIGTGLRDVSVSATINGMTGIASTHCNVSLPAYNLTTQIDNVHLSTMRQNTGYELGLGYTYQSDIADGDWLHGVVFAVTFSDAEHTANWKQIVEASTSKMTRDTPGREQLEWNQYDCYDILNPEVAPVGVGSWYSPETDTLIDTPYTRWFNDDVDSVEYSREDHFSSYLYIENSNDFSNCPVPVKVVEWGWGAKVTATGDPIDRWDLDVTKAPYKDVREFNCYPSIPSVQVSIVPDFVPAQ